MKSLVGLLVACAYLLAPVSACGMGGIGAPSTGALIALCVVFLPVIVPVGGGYLAYKGIEKGAHKVKKVADNMKRKRNSDIIKTQMSRALKRMGRDAFAKHIQQLFDVAREEQTSKAYFDLGLALFLNRDLMKAEEYMNEAIKVGTSGADNFSRLPHAYFVRGLVNQYMWAFQQAASDFEESARLFDASNPSFESFAGQEVNGIPQLTAQDALNSYGFALQLEALYNTPPADESGRGLELLDKAIRSYDVALERAAIKQGMWYHNRGVARYFRTYRVPGAAPEWVAAELQLALEDFISAIHSGNFGTAADGYAMAAQTLTRLKKPAEEIQPYVQSAYDADPKVFMVDLQDEGELATPWPLPRQDFPFKKSPHEFEKVFFSKPTWCDHCMGFIKNPLQKQGYECKKCSYHVHSKCFPQVKGKSCYNEELTVLKHFEPEVSATHTHHFKPTWFHKPTWCDHCHKFVVSPVGKQGFRCTDCKFAVHKECVLQVKGFIED